MPNPTVVAASLDDQQLRTSIDALVKHVDDSFKRMVNITNTTVSEMQSKLQSLKNVNIDLGGASGDSKRSASVRRETEARKELTQTLDKQVEMMQKAQQVSIRSGNSTGVRNADTLQTMNIQLDLLRERLREARQQYSAFVVLARDASTTGDKGYYQFATQNVHRYQEEVRSLIPQIRALQAAIQQMGDVIAPQGHTIQNYVNSLQRANPELAQLNAQFKSGQSLLQQQATETERASSSVKYLASAEYDAAEAAKYHATMVREYASEARTAFMSGQPYFMGERNRTQIFAENDARARGLTIEQQIEAVLAQEMADYERQGAATIVYAIQTWARGDACEVE